MEHRAPPPSLAGDDEIEIVEIVGLDEGRESSPATRPGGPAARRTAAAQELVVEIGPRPGRAGDLSPADVREQLLRLSADFENFRRRAEREREANERHASASLIGRLLPVLDNFERALSREPGGGADRLYDGVALIFRQLLDELRKEGLVAVDSVGEPFDPEFHEAVATTVEDALPPDIVVEELQRGYRLHERLLRPSLVRVTVDRRGPGSASGRTTKGR